MDDIQLFYLVLSLVLCYTCWLVGSVTVYSLIMQRGDPIILCFVDFATPACAATAMSALQGDEFLIFIDPDRNQFRGS